MAQNFIECDREQALLLPPSLRDWPRRTVLDRLLVDAASEAGAEVREEFTVTDPVIEEGRVTGIRGHSRASPPSPSVRGWSLVQTVTTRSWPARSRHTSNRGRRRLAAVRADHEQEGHRRQHPRDARPGARLRCPLPGRHARTRFVGMSLANFLQKPFGPGWALVGDAGYTKDFITGLGISDAFRDASLCATALDGAFSGARPFTEAMAAYQAERDRSSLPFYEFTAQLATLEPLPPELERLLDVVHGDQEEMDPFARVGGAVTSPAEFLSEENVGRLLAAGSAGPRRAR